MDYEKIYKTAFQNKNYNSDHSLSYGKAIEFLSKLQQEHPIDSISDIGSGNGNLIRKLPKEKNIFSYDLDCFYEASAFGNVVFEKIDLSSPTSLHNIKKVDLLYCLDVLEHIEEKHIDLILHNFSKKCNFCFLTIANHSDVINGVELHLIQKNETFWNEKVGQFFKINHFEKAYGNRLYLYQLSTKNL